MDSECKTSTYMFLKRVSLLTLLSVLLVGIFNASAVPAYPGPITVTQSDGTQLTIRIYGDEFSHYVLSQDGYTLVGGADGDYYFAKLSNDGNLVPSAIKAKPIGRLTKAERTEVLSRPKQLKPTAISPLKKMPMRYLSIPTSNGDKQAAPESRATTKGKLKSIVILVTFKDQNFTVASPKQAFFEMLNKDGYNKNNATGSAWNFYQDNSNKQFDPEFDVVGPVALPKSTNYYGGETGTQNPAEMIVEACKAASAAGTNFSQYADGGVIRDVFIFYAGHNQAEGAEGTVWPHRWDVRYDRTHDYSNVLINGVQLRGYACSSELKGASGSTMAGIGTFCHEFGHVLGWPDFYDTDDDGSGGAAAGLEDYSLMCAGSYNNNGRTPPAITLLERWLVGWAEPTELVSTGEYTLEPVWKDNGKGYLIKTSTKDEYFLIETRGIGTETFVWEKYLGTGAKGMLVYHIDRSSKYIRKWEDNTLNADPSHECAKLVRSVPTSAVAQNYPPSKTFFPGSTNVTTFTGNKHYISWSNVLPVIQINNIKLAGDVLTFSAQGSDEMQLTTQANQYDAMLTWTGAKQPEWGVSWKENGSSTVLGTTKVTSPALHLINLKPATTYKVTITPKDTKLPAQDFTFNTKNVSTTAYTRINSLKGEYRVGEGIVLSILDYKGELKQINWSVDDKPTTETYLVLPAGEHCLMATLIGKNDEIQHIIKYITVK